MYDPLAVATVIDPTLVTLQNMHVDVETKGEFTRGETVANRRDPTRTTYCTAITMRSKGSFL